MFRLYALIAGMGLMLPTTSQAEENSLCAFSPGERLAALESLVPDLKTYVDEGGFYPAQVSLLPPGVIDELPPALSGDTVWLWPAADEPVGDDDRLTQGDYLAASCLVVESACAAQAASVCYALLDGSAAFCNDSTRASFSEAGRCDTAESGASASP